MYELCDLDGLLDLKRDLARSNGYGDKGYSRFADPIQGVRQFTLDEVNDDIVSRINGLGISLDRITVREGRPEEILDAYGKYFQGEILVNPVYTDQTGEALFRASFYFDLFMNNHFASNFEDRNKLSQVAQMRHLVEDIVAHEYGHHVFKNVYRDDLVREAVQVGEFHEALYSNSSRRFEEGFARWFNGVVVGHSHPSVRRELIADIDDDNFYSNKPGIIMVYDALLEAEEKHGAQYVLDNLVEIGTPVLVELGQREHQRELDRAVDNGYDFSSFILN